MPEYTPKTPPLTQTEQNNRDESLKSNENLDMDESIKWLEERGIKFYNREWQPGMKLIVFFSDTLKNIFRRNIVDWEAVFIPSFALLDDVEFYKLGTISLNEETRLTDWIGIDTHSRKPIILKTREHKGKRNQFELSGSVAYSLTESEFNRIRQICELS